MRIRLRATNNDDGRADKEPGGIIGWLQRCGSGSTSEAEGTSAGALPTPDRRWAEHGEARYYVAGRECSFVDGKWLTAYVLDVIAGGEYQPVRVVLEEPAIETWQKAKERRMTEAQRLGLALETLHGLLDLDRLPAAITVTSEAISVR